MKTFRSFLALAMTWALYGCLASGESGYKSFRTGSAESVGFDSKKLSRVDSVITAAIRDSAFPAAQVCVVKEGVVAFNKAFGRFTYDASSPQTSLQSLFDIASLTKVIATTSAFMKLYDDGKISLDDKVGKFIPQFTQGKKSGITLRHLLTHTSGLPPFRQLWKICPDAGYAFDTVCATALVASPGDTSIYSDLGFIVLGRVVEKVSQMPLHNFMGQNFFLPLGMLRTMFSPPQVALDEVAPTEYDSLWRKRLIQGTVHDENAAFGVKISGHAGLFSTAHDLAIMVQMLMNGGTYEGKRYLDSSTITMFTKKQSEKSSSALGWDTKSPMGSSAGNLFSPNSFGHTGFTGTSIWADPERNLFVILLTNHVYPTRANGKIFKIRPVVHDAVIEALAK